MPCALITGAGRGIGLATAARFLSAGWRVLALDKQFSAAFDHTAPSAEKITFDLRHTADIPDLLAGMPLPIDTLVNNAAVLFCDPQPEAIPDEHRREILAVNLEAPAALIAGLAPQWRSRCSGRVVNVSSVSAFTGHPDLWYGITKAGILNLTKSWARALGPCHVLVNAVAPGPTRTAMYDQLPQSRKDAVMAAVYSGRICTAEEVAQVIFWLGAESPAYVNGATIDVNDGSYPR